MTESSDKSNVGNIEKSIYEMMGGGDRVRELVDSFYDLMELEPEFKILRELHPADLTSSRDKLFMFLSGWMGGPNLFVEKFGHPRLRARHLPFSIGSEERDQWVTCMAHALNAIGVEDEIYNRLMQSFYDTADWMRNRAD